jgi:hypothetical protein
VRFSLIRPFANAGERLLIFCTASASPPDARASKDFQGGLATLSDERAFLFSQYRVDVQLERVGGVHRCYPELVALHQASDVFNVPTHPIQLGDYNRTTISERLGACWTLQW